MNKFTKADEGAAAIYTDTDGTTYSCEIARVAETLVWISWRVSPTSWRHVIINKPSWDRLKLFPVGAMFVGI